MTNEGALHQRIASEMSRVISSEASSAWRGWPGTGVLADAALRAVHEQKQEDEVIHLFRQDCLNYNDRDNFEISRSQALQIAKKLRSMK